jgi:hypothetical protein
VAATEIHVRTAVEIPEGQWRVARANAGVGTVKATRVAEATTTRQNAMKT